MKRRLMISWNLRMEIGMDIGSKSKQAIFHNNLTNAKLNRNILVNLYSINCQQRELREELSIVRFKTNLRDYYRKA